jgi:O-antigen/teichoic acid export membrane protein
VSTRTPSRDTVRGGVVIAIAMAVMNVTTYAFTILAARLLGPPEYGALAAVMGLLLVVNVLSLGLQATGARRVSAAPEDLASIERTVMSTTYLAAVVLGLLALAAAPVVAVVLNLDSWVAAVLIAVTAVPLTVMGGQAGIFQGERRWVPLAVIYLCVGLGRIGFGAVALVVEPTTTGAMVGVAVGAALPAAYGWFALHRRAQRREPASHPHERTHLWARGGVLRETLLNSHALLAFFALSNVDIVVARSTLGEHQAGLYGGGLILTKAVLFLPQFVVVVAFPSMSRQGAGRQKHLLSVAVVFGIGVATVLGTAVLAPLAVLFIGGPEYAALQDRLWVFAVLGTLLAMIQLLIYNIVARRRQRTVLLVWAAFVGVLASTPFVNGVDSLLRVVVCADSLLFLVLLGRSLAPSYHPPVPREPVAENA